VRSTVLRRLAPALLLVALAASACDTVSNNAATVNGHGISVDDLLDEANVYVCSEAVGGELAQRLAGDGDGTFATSAVAQVLTDRIHLMLLEDRFAEDGIKVSSEDRDAARQQLDEGIAGLPSSKDKACLTKEFREYFVRQRAVSAAIQAQLSQDDLIDILCDDDVRISVTPSYGRWDRSGCRDGTDVGFVVPPAQPEAK
jgi:hypothetical protein